MEKKKQTPKKEASKENNLDALEDSYVYGAGHEVDESFSTEDEDDIAGHTNGGIPDVIEGDDDDDEEEDDDRN
jgi:hypothetical protein